MKASAVTEGLAPPTTEPVVRPSIPTPRTDPLEGLGDVVEEIRLDGNSDPGEYLDEIRVLLGGE